MMDMGGSSQASMYISLAYTLGGALGLFSCVNTKSDTLRSPIPPLIVTMAPLLRPLRDTTGRADRV